MDSVPPAPEPSYETVEPMIARSRVDGQEMEYVFRCPVTGFEATGRAPIPQYAAPDRPSVAQMTASSMLNPNLGVEARDAADRAVPWSGTLAGIGRNVFGYRRVKREYAESQQAAEATQHEGAQQLALAAFSSVVDRFTWDAAGTRWVKAGG